MFFLRRKRFFILQLTSGGNRVMIGHDKLLELVLNNRIIPVFTRKFICNSVKVYFHVLNL